MQLLLIASLIYALQQLDNLQCSGMVYTKADINSETTGEC